MWLQRLLVLSTFGASVVWPAVAWSEPSSCAIAYEKAQEHRSDSRLRAARRQLEICVAPECSDFIRGDCGRWLGEVESALPSLVLVVKAHGKEIEDVQVFFDNELLASRLDGKAIAVDAGRHKLQFVRRGVSPVTQELMIREGEKNRLVSVDLGGRPEPVSPLPAKPTSTAPALHPVSRGWLPYALGGVGVLGITGFAVLGIMGHGEKADREKSCAPECGDGDVGSVRTKYNLADASLGVGVVALGVAAYLYFTAPTTERTEPSESKKVSVDVRMLPNGGFAAFGAQF